MVIVVVVVVATVVPTVAAVVVPTVVATVVATVAMAVVVAIGDNVALGRRLRDWLVLIEAVTSHGPVDGKRHAPLALCASVLPLLGPVLL